MVRARRRFASRGSAGHARRDHRLAASRPARRQDGDDRRRRRAARPRARIQARTAAPTGQEHAQRAHLPGRATAGLPGAGRRAGATRVAGRRGGPAGLVRAPDRRRALSGPGARPRRRRSRRESAVAVPGHGGGQDPGRAAAGHRRGPVDAQRDASLDRRRQRGARPASAACLAHAIAAGIISQHSSHGHRQPVSCRRAGQARRRGFSLAAAPARRRRALARVPAASQDADRLGW